MTWQVSWHNSALRELRKLSKQAQSDILKYLRERIATKEDPRRFGKALKSNMKGLWRYCVGDYRIVCQIQDEYIKVLVVTVGHRSKIYDSR